MKPKQFLFLLVILFFSCKKDSNSSSGTAAKNAVVLNSNTVPITMQYITYSGTANLEIMASSDKMDVHLLAKSYTHASGVGDYFLWCCNNEVLEKTAGGEDYKGVDGPVNGSAMTEKGSLSVSRRDEKGFAGTFSFQGRSSNGKEKTFSGSFTVTY